MANKHKKNKSRKVNIKDTGLPSQSDKNPHFSLTVKQMYRFLQTKHHIAVLNSLPKNQLPPALGRKKNELDRFWKPSGANEKFQEKIKEISFKYMEAGINLMRSHYDDISKEIEQKLDASTLSADQFEKAKNISKSWAKKNFKKKLNNQTLEKLDKLHDQIFSKRKSDLNTQPQNTEMAVQKTTEKKSMDTATNETVVKSKATASPQNTGGKQVLESTASNVKANKIELAQVTQCKTPVASTPDKRKRVDSPPSSPDEGSPQLRNPSKIIRGDNGSPSQVPQPLTPVSSLQKIMEGDNISPPTTTHQTPGGQTNKRKHVASPTCSPNSTGGITPSPSSPSEQPPAAKKAEKMSPQRLSNAPKKSITPIRSEGPKNAWSLPKIDTKRVFLGDSNISRITKAHGSNLTVLSYPGASYYNLHMMLRKADPQRIVNSVVFSIGINERSNKVDTTSLPRLNKLMLEAKRVFPNAKIHLASLQWNPSKLPPSENKTLEELQSNIEKMEDINLIPKLSSNLFKIEATDKSGIHWSKECANAMIENWINHLN